MRIQFFFILLIFSGPQAFSQVTFEKTFGTVDDDDGAAIEICHDGTYILAGNVENIYTGDPDIYLARLNVYGDTLWTRTFINEYHSDFAYDVIQSHDHGFIVTGYTYSNDSSMPFLLKYDESGEFLWFKKYGQEIPDGYAYALVQKPDSGLMICGRRDYYTSDWYHRPFLLETNEEGDCLWYDIYTFSTYGHYEVRDICLSPENEYILCGYYEDPLVLPIEHAWLFKIESGLNVAWDKVYGPSDFTSFSSDVEVTEDGGYLLCGSRYQGSIPFPGTDYDIYLIKTNGSGEEEWSRSVGDEEYSEHGYSIDKTYDGGYIVGGITNFGVGHNDVWILKTNESGDTLWTRTYGGVYDEGIADICATPDGGYLICGHTYSSGLGGSDIYIIKTDENGLLTNISEQKDALSEIEIAPNPGNGIFNMSNCPDDLTYSVYDFNSRIILTTRTVAGTNGNVDLSHFAPGIYFVRLHSGKGSRSVKVIKMQ